MSTIKDVASLAGVTPSTVSRVLSDSPRISKSTKERVRQAIQQLNYHPNSLALGLKTRSAKAIGILIPGDMPEFFINPFFGEVMSGINDVARKEGFQTVLSTTGQSESEVLDDMMHSHRVDGLLLLKNTQDDTSIIKAVEHKFPAALLGRPSSSVKINYVDNDNVEASHNAANYLITLGHTRIGFIGGSTHLTSTIDRITGYRFALEEAGIDVDERMIIMNSHLPQSGYLDAIKLLALPTRPTAILTSDDMVAFGVIRAAMELGYNLPRDLSIVGFNDVTMSQFSYPSLTTVNIRTFKLGQSLAETLFDQIMGRPTSESKIINSELVKRNSCTVVPD